MERIKAAIDSKPEGCTCSNATEHIAKIREMSNLENPEDVDIILKLMSDVKRFRLLKLLLKTSPLCVCEISTALQIDQTLTSHHLSTLRANKLVEAKRRGRWVHYELADKELIEKVVTSIENLSAFLLKNKE
jgi:ArsR family transcriptional regulator